VPQSKLSGISAWLRKAGATPENGATINQLMALFGWKTEKMASLYTRKADRKRLAATAAPLLLRNDVGEMPMRMDSEQGAARPVGCGSKPNTSRKMRRLENGLVPLAGLEPARCCHHLILSQARLPIPAQGLAGGS
jgi:hypothetical protein